MKPFSFAVCAFSALVAIATPAAAQMSGYSDMEFVEAVRKSDGDKVQELLRAHPASANDITNAEPLRRADRLCHEHVDDGALK